MLNERSLTKSEEKRKEDLVKRFKKDKRDWVARYGKDAEAIMYGTAVKNAKKQVKEMNENRIKEAVKKALSIETPIKERDEWMEPEDYADLMALKDATAMMDAIEDLYKKAKALGYGPDVKKLVADLDEELKGGQKKIDVNQDGEISGEDFKLLRAKKGMKEAEDGVISTDDPATAEKLAKKGVNVNLSIKEDWGSSDQAIMNKSIHRSLGNPEEFPSLNQVLAAAEDAVDFYMDDFEEYDTDREGLVNFATRSYLKNYFPELFKGMSDMLSEDYDIGHEDNEPHMLKGDLYRIGKYAMELYQMVDEFEGKGEVDFPAWWQAMITDASAKMVKAKHYLDFETKEPEIDAMVGAIDKADAFDNVGVDQPVFEEEAGEVDKLAAAVQKALNAGKISKDEAETFRKMLNKGDLKGVEMAGLEEGLPKGFWAKKIPGGKMDESYEALVKKIKGQGKSEKAAKAIAGAVASYKAKGGGKGPTAKQKK